MVLGGFKSHISHLFNFFKGKIMFEKQIENGIDFLNENYPGWLRKINTNKLDMNDPKFCILGQVGGFYSIQDFFDLSWDECDDLGFSVLLAADNNGIDLYPTLQEEWINKIKELRNNE
jgi:hypothetical protein